VPQVSLPVVRRFVSRVEEAAMGVQVRFFWKLRKMTPRITILRAVCVP